MNRYCRLAAVTALAAGAAGVGAPAAATPPPEGTCVNADPASPRVSGEPWAQKSLDPESVWPHSTGAGVRVAVVDSGVDSDHPQLRGTVLPGRDFYYQGDRPGTFDCASHGTAVASIIAAEQAPGIGFAGLAPGARILPVRVVEREASEDGAAESIDPAVLARGIRYAADHGARVINLSLAGQGADARVRDAVVHAEQRDALVVASVGNAQQDSAGDATTYPAGYPGVLGVGAVDNAGQRLTGSQTGSQVDIAAPGDGVLAAARVAGHRYWKGTSFAAPFVSATAALVRQRYPQLSADQVARRIVATTTPAPGGRRSTGYGVGIVDPYRAVTERLSSAAPAALPVVHPQYVDPQRVRAAAWWDRADGTARLGAVVAGAVAALGLALAVVLRRGRRSRWRAHRAAALPADRVVEEPPDEVFLLQPPESER